MKTKSTAFSILFTALILGSVVASANPVDEQPIIIRTESYPRPPYSGATYYIYEQDGTTVCTKFEVCNKYNDCEVTYFDGMLKQSYDIRTGAPYETTGPVEISPTSLKKHVCLTKFGVI